MSDYSTYSDEQLLLQLRSDDQCAFKEFYERYWEKLFITAHFRLDNAAEAEELVQDVFLNLWRRRHTLEIKNSPSTYLAAAVKYEVINRLSRQARTITINTTNEHPSIADNSTAEQLSFNELESSLARLVKSLPDKCRLVFTLSRERGFSQKQIAKELNISENTVESHIKYALRSLRAGLQHFFTFFL